MNLEAHELVELLKLHGEIVAAATVKAAEAVAVQVRADETLRRESELQRVQGELATKTILVEGLEDDRDRLYRLVEDLQDDAAD